MIDASKLDTSMFRGTARLILQDALLRNWKVAVLKEGSSHFYIDRGDGKHLHIQSSIIPSLSFIAGSTANNKFMTSQLLSEAGIKQLDSIVTRVIDHVAIRSFLESNKTIVVKPLDGAHGNGVRTNLQTVSEVSFAIEYAQQYTKSGAVILQEQFPSQEIWDIRLLCMDQKYSAAIHRVPARVFGDGILSVLELIKKENESPDRGMPYMKKLAFIDIERALKYLGESAESIPKPGEEVRVIDVANYGAGGEIHDITDDIPDWMKHQAELAARTLDLPVAGVDYLVSAKPECNMKENEMTTCIIEVNKGPSLAIHDEPHSGKNRHTVSMLLDMIASL